MKKIGVFVPRLCSRFHRELWPGMQEYANTHGVQLIYFVGGDPLPDEDLFLPDYEAQKAITYSLARSGELEGIIVSPSLRMHLNDEAFSLFCNQFYDTPIVTLCHKFASFPSVNLDNVAGIRDIILHLVQDHGYTRLAFFRGSSNMPDAEIRFNTYKQTLKSLGIDYTSELVFQGDFSRVSGQLCAKSLLKSCQNLPDAVVSANDEMALGAMDVFRQEGYSVPEDIAITGFDNLFDAEFTFPALTTVSQPIGYMGVAALKYLLGHLESNEAGDVVLNARVFFRESCGCQRDITSHRLTGQVLEEESDLILRLEAIISEPSMDYLKSDIKSFYYHLLNVPSEGNRELSVISVFSELLFHARRQRNCLRDWIIILQEIRTEIHCTSLVSDEEFLYINLIIQKCLSMVYEALWREESSVYYEKLTDIRIISMMVNNRISSAFSLKELYETFDEYLPQIHLDNLFLVFYDKGDEGLVLFDQKAPDKSRLMFCYSRTMEVERTPLTIFPTSEILPDGMLSILGEQSSLACVFSLHTPDRQFGYIVMGAEVNPYFPLAYEDLAESINTAIKANALLVELGRTRRQLIHTEKMSSMGTLLKGLAHEMNNPLNFISLGIQCLEDTTTTQERSEIVDSMKQGVVRMTSLVRALDLFFIDVHAEPEPVNLLKCFESALAVLRPLYQDRIFVNNSISEEDIPEFEGDPKRITQMLTMILRNHFEVLSSKLPGEGMVSISGCLSLKSDNEVVLFIENNGGPIPDEFLSRLFDPFFRLPVTGQFDSQGLGLGLYHVYTILEKMKGSIQITNQSSSVLYTVCIPTV